MKCVMLTIELLPGKPKCLFQSVRGLVIKLIHLGEMAHLYYIFIIHVLSFLHILYSTSAK